MQTSCLLPPERILGGSHVIGIGGGLRMTKLIKNIELIRLTKPKSIMRTIKHLGQLREHLRLKQLRLERKFLRGRM